ncbi:MAG: rane protein [Bacteroidetes bacterium]|jgi:preprotein translocase subunit YajC|nr:rane protein [Bacteroidota bacterium]
MLQLNVLLQAVGAGGNSMVSTVIMLVAIVAIFYFFMIRPQQKRQKALQEARAAMKVGDKVVTAGGVHGRIREVSDTYFLVEISDGVKIKIEKASVFASSEEASQN